MVQQDAAVAAVPRDAAVVALQDEEVVALQAAVAQQRAPMMLARGLDDA